jgi:hypothetical protein
MEEGDDVAPDESPRGPVTVTKVRLLGAVGGYVIIEWVLSSPPGPAWSAAFSRAEPTGKGATVILLGGSGSPKVRADGTIRWSVPHADISGAVSFVLESVLYANSSRFAPGPSNGRADRVGRR